MSTVYAVIKPPTYCDGDPSSHFNVGDRVRLHDADPDTDGDVQAVNETSGSGAWHHLALDCLRAVDDDTVAPVNDHPTRVSLDAVRAVLTVRGMPADEVFDVVRHISRVDAALLG